MHLQLASSSSRSSCLSVTLWKCPTDLGPQETLLHFAARRGLRRVALFLLQQPGGRDALRHQNKQGHTPAGVAQKRGHIQLQHLLSELEDSPCYETKPARRRVPGGRAFLHHPKLNTYTLTVDGETDVFPPDLRADVEELQRFIQSHQQEKAKWPVMCRCMCCNGCDITAMMGKNRLLLQYSLEHPHTVPADGAVGVEVEGHQAFWTCDDKPFILVLTTVPPHTDSLGVSTKTKAGLVTEDDPLPF
ncbi:hypothetical protein NFI96_000630 [Prochilodus magdalenae]|nr:hypothetical protein NFI96_000630 [Prochilodus magdalenae]